VKVGGGLNYVTGPMGAGKTLYGTRRIIAHVSAGQYAVTNVELLPGWSTRVAKRLLRFRPFHRLSNRHAVAELAAKLEARYVYETDLAKAMRYRLPGEGEARGLFLWDEGHNDLNNRDWNGSGSTADAKEADRQRRRDLMRWATQLRKLGYVGYLLTQHADNTDAALRRICNFHIRLQNQREQTRLLGIRITPVPLFLAVWTSTNAPLASTTKPVKVERYFLSWHKKLYDSWGLFHGLDAAEQGDTIMLPKGGRVAAPQPALVTESLAGGQAGAAPLDVTTDPAVTVPAAAPTRKPWGRPTRVARAGLRPQGGVNSDAVAPQA
jgi:hypothetical protein